MQNIVGTRIHDEILGMIDRARGGVILVSPFVRMWPELRRAVARAVARGVNLSLITRGPNGGPRDEDLATFYELEADVREVPDLHLKAYLSENEAIHTSVNLTRQSVDRSLESSLLFDREQDPEGWNNVFEVWHKTLDDAARAQESGPLDFEKFLLPLRTRADAGEASARAAHRYCIVCGTTASTEADEVVCLRCRAATIADNGDPQAIVGARCARCNGTYRRSTVERPLCDACYRSEQERYVRRPATWYVSGATGAVEVWSSAEEGRVSALSPHAQEALRRRWGVLLRKGGCLAGAVTAITPKPLVLWTCGTPPEGVDITDLGGLALERVPAKTLPLCRDLPNYAPEKGLHISYKRSETPGEPTFWAVDERLAAWDVALPRNADASKITAPDWVWAVLLAPRRGFAADVSYEPGKVHLLLDLALTVPSDLRSKWKDAATFLQQVMLASLHTYAGGDIRDWLAGGTPKKVEALAEFLGGPSPFGPAALIRSSRGKIRDLPSRGDRVTAIRVAVGEGEGWHVKGSVSKVKKAAVH